MDISILGFGDICHIYLRLRWARILSGLYSTHDWSWTTFNAQWQKIRGGVRPAKEQYGILVCGHDYKDMQKVEFNSDYQVLQDMKNFNLSSDLTL